MPLYPHARSFNGSPFQLALRSHTSLALALDLRTSLSRPQQTNITQATLASLALLAILLIEQGVSDGIIVVTIWPHPAPDVGPLESRRSMWVKGMKAHRAGVRFPSDSPFVPNSVS